MATHLDRDVRAREEQPVRTEGLRNRDRHQEAAEHDSHQEQADRDRVGIELVRHPGRVVPGPPDDEQHERRLSCALPGQVVEQQVRDLGDREDEDQVVEQLERRRPLLLSGVPLRWKRVTPGACVAVAMTSSRSGSSRPSIHAALIVSPSSIRNEERAATSCIPPSSTATPNARADLAVPVGEQRHVHAERSRPGRVRPHRVARDRERPHARLEPDPRSCHAGAAPRSFRWATSPRGRSRGARSPRRAPAVAERDSSRGAVQT